MAPRHRYYFFGYPHFTDEETPAQRCHHHLGLRSHSSGPGFIPNSAISLTWPCPRGGISFSLRIYEPHFLDDTNGLCGYRLALESLWAWLLSKPRSLETPGWGAALTIASQVDFLEASALCPLPSPETMAPSLPDCSLVPVPPRVKH